MKRKLLLCFLSGILAAAPLSTDAKIKHLLPRPQAVEATADAQPFALGREVALTDPTNNAALRAFLQTTNCTVADGAAATVTVTLVDEIKGAYDFELAGFPNEGYAIEIEADAVRIFAITETGVTRAAQTLAQLAQGWEGTPALEALSMTDWPAFKFRGFMQDVGRSFVSVEQIKREIDILAQFKVNLFHWHLTENQAWRFEVKRYPQLTSAESMTRFAGKYYTQEECREVQEYAAARGVSIIPEIDMPGHSAAYKRAMGHGMQTAEGVEELQYILEEVAEVFDKSAYIHIGADEETISYPNFLQTMIAKVKSLGKRVMVWNPIRGVDISTLGVDMTQMWSTSGRAVEGVANIDCRYNYTNHFDVFADLVGIYKSNIYYKDKGDATTPGFISCPWNDRKTPTEADIFRQNSIYAHTIASAERAWIGGGKQYIEKGGTTLPNSGEEYDEFADWERRFLFHKDNSFGEERDLVPYVKQTNVRWRITEAFPNDGDKTKQFPPETEELKESFTYEGKTYGTGMATGAGIYLRHTWGSIIPTYFSNPQNNTTAYAWTYVYSPKAQTVGAFIELQNYGRSENDKAPDAGCWDRKGSRLFINDKEVLPPVWGNSGKGINSEVDLLNENFTARAPQQVELKEGWNKVFFKLPYIGADGVRLNKWMFTFVLTDLEGRNALEDVIYSPNRCMDNAAEQVAAAVSEARNFRNGKVGTTPGYYPESLAATLDALLDAVTETLPEALTGDERAAQLKQIADALEAFKASLQSASVIMPAVSTSKEIFAYTLTTPFRGSRVITSHGVGQEILGDASATDASAWKFEQRTDGTLNIVNISDGSYISPVANHNTALKTSATVPAKGWTLSPAEPIGHFIVTSGDVQFNQTNSGLGYKLYNWGGGNNLTDDGCRFRIEQTDVPGEVTPPAQPEAAVTLVNLEIDGKPYRLSDELAKTVFDSETLTVAVDYTQPATSEVSSLVATVNENVTDSYLSMATMTSGNHTYGVRYNDNGGWYTQRVESLTGRHRMVLVMGPDGLKYYLDGTFGRSVSASPQPIFQNVAGKTAIYLGGFLTTSETPVYPFIGTLHSVRFFDKELTAAEIAALNYDNLTATAVNTVVSDGTDTPQAVYDLSGRRVLRPGKGIYIVNGRKVVK